MGLFVLPAVAALLLVRHHHLNAATVTILVSVALGLPLLWLTWAIYRESRRPEIGKLSLAELADQFADIINTQWAAEAAARRLNDPYPLTVCWTAADASLSDTWDALVRLAETGAGWPSPPTEGTWAESADALAGGGNDLVNVLAKVPTGRLAVLGEPGAGKTMLMVRLTLDLLARRTGGSPVPVLVSVASWDPMSQELREWLADRLGADYPALTAPALGGGNDTCIEALLEAGLILPLLDGLDEIPGAVRGPAISRINDAVRAGEQVVVTCRTEAYRDAVRPPHRAEVSLRAAAVIQLQPLDAGTVSCYLRDDAAGPVAAARWTPVLAVLGTQEPVGQALTTPLMAGLACAIYNPRPGENIRELRNPAELCDPALADRVAVESHLFDAFIPAAYRLSSAPRWTAENAEKWLTYIANRQAGSFAWWRLRDMLPPTLTSDRHPPTLLGIVMAGLATGLAGGFAGGLAQEIAVRLAVRLAIGLTVGLTVGIAGGLAHAARSYYSPERRGPGPADMLAGAPGFVIGFVPGFAVGIAGRLASGLAENIAVGIGGGIGVGIAGVLCVMCLTSPIRPSLGLRWTLRSLEPFWDVYFSWGGRWRGYKPSYEPLRYKLRRTRWLGTSIASITVSVLLFEYGDRVARGLIIGLALVFALATSLAGAPGNLEDAISPRATLARDRRAALAFALVTAVVLGLVFGFTLGLVFGIMLGLGLGLTISSHKTAWPAYTLSRMWVAAFHQLPWFLMDFLADAHRRGVLRQAGAFYEFRHIELHRRLRARPQKPNRGQGNDFRQ